MRFIVFSCMIYFFVNVCAESQSTLCPRVSIITSLFKGDAFIVNFMREIVKQTIFNQCELIIINANSPGNEEDAILPYLEKYPNIIYKKLDEDPGIYGVWNMAIEMAHGEYIINANVDDGFSYDALEKYVKFLDEDPNIDLVYSDFYLVESPADSLYTITDAKVCRRPDFSLRALSIICLPNCHPMWRKSMHEKYGYFDANYFSAGDYEMWIRAALKGSTFKRIPEILGFFYHDPKLTKNVGHHWPHEYARICEIYKEFFAKYRQR